MTKLDEKLNNENYNYTYHFGEALKNSVNSKTKLEQKLIELGYTKNLKKRETYHKFYKGVFECEMWVRDYGIVLFGSVTPTIKITSPGEIEYLAEALKIVQEDERILKDLEVLKEYEQIFE